MAITNSAELEKFFSLRSRDPDKSGDFVDAGDAVYKFEPKAGRIYVAWRTTDVKPVARSTFTRRIKSIRASHEALAQKLGIPAEQVMFTDFREILTKTDPRAATPTAASVAGTPIMAEGGTTTLLRASLRRMRLSAVPSPSPMAVPEPSMRSRESELTMRWSTE